MSPAEYSALWRAMDNRFAAIEAELYDATFRAKDGEEGQWDRREALQEERRCLHEASRAVATMFPQVVA